MILELGRPRMRPREVPPVFRVFARLPRGRAIAILAHAIGTGQVSDVR